jgi:hypothetical protein
VVKVRKTVWLSLCLLFAIISINAQVKQYQEVNISFNQGSIEQYLDTIQQQTSIAFVYSDAISPESLVQIEKGRYKVKQILDSLFQTQSVLYVERDNLIILSPQLNPDIANNKVIVSGKVFTRKNIPVPFASIYIENKSLGTIANAEGVFRFVLPNDFTSDTLTVSSMGYESVKIAPEEYLTGELNLNLRTANIPIKDVIVRPQIPENIVMDSYNSRLQNYSNNYVIMSAFFRESSKQDDDYISLSEALIEIKKSSYASEINDLVRLVKGRNGTNIKKSEFVNLVVEGGLYNSLRLDVAKYGSYFYSETAQQECDFKFLKTIFLNNNQTYVIAFKAKANIDYAGYNGVLYIDAETLALVRAEFELSEQGIKYARSILVKKSPRGYKTKPNFAKYEVEYRYYNNVWNLHYARSEFGIKVRKTRRNKALGYSCNFTSTSEFVITGNSDSTIKRIPFSAIAKPNDVLVEQVESTQSGFWHSDNIIVPEEPLQTTIKKLQLEGQLSKETNTISKGD